MTPGKKLARSLGMPSKTPIKLELERKIFCDRRIDPRVTPMNELNVFVAMQLTSSSTIEVTMKTQPIRIVQKER